MQFTKGKKVAAVLGAGAIAVAGGGVAYAYWTSTGGGSGTASTSNGDASANPFLTVTQNTVLAAMYPGDTAQGFTAKVTNDSTDGSSVYVTSVKAYLTVAKAASPPAGAGTCTASDYLLNGVSTASTVGTAVSLHWTNVELATTGTQDTGSGDTIQFNDKNGVSGVNQDGCKGATVTIHYLAS